MARINIILDENPSETTLKLTKIKTKKSLIDYTLRELIRHKKQYDLLKLKSKIKWEVI